MSSERAIIARMATNRPTPPPGSPRPALPTYPARAPQQCMDDCAEASVAPFDVLMDQQPGPFPEDHQTRLPALPRPECLQPVVPGEVGRLDRVGLPVAASGCGPCPIPRPGERGDLAWHG